MRTKYSINQLFALFASFFFLLVSCSDDDDAAVVEISLDKDLISLVLGTSETLTATVTPNNSYASSIEWISTNEDVITVAGGVVQAVGVGRAMVNAKIGASASFCEVIVTAVPVDETDIILNKTELDLKIGDMETLKATIEPIEATDKRIRWSSSHPEIVSVEEKSGKVTAHALGEAVITVRTLNANKTASCTVSVLSVLELLSPTDQVQITPNVIDPDDKLTFSWAMIPGLETYRLQLNTVVDFEGDVLYSQDVNGTSFDISSFDLNEFVKGSEGSPVSLFWTVKSKSADLRVFSLTRTLNIVPDRNEYLLLNTGSAAGVNIEKLTGAYQYALTTTGRSSVNTVALQADVASNAIVVSFMYKSNKDLNSMTINFVSGGQTKATIQKTVPATSDWKEMRIVFDQSILDDWGATGDYLQLAFGQDAGYEITLNGLYLTPLNYDEEKERYTPELLKIRGWSGHVTPTHNENDYFGFTTTATDPNITTEGITKPIPSGAVILSFEYRSNMDIKNNLQVFIGLKNGPGLAEGRSKKFGIMPKASNWTVYTADMTSVFHDWGWGQTIGDYLRMDTGEQAGLDMDIRNIQIKFKD